MNFPLESNVCSNDSRLSSQTPQLITIDTDVNYKKSKNQLVIRGSAKFEPINGVSKTTVMYDNKIIDSFYITSGVNFARKIDFNPETQNTDYVMLLISYPNQPSTIGWVIVCEM
jgi:hypothetical protein